MIGILAKISIPVTKTELENLLLYQQLIDGEYEDIIERKTLERDIKALRDQFGFDTVNVPIRYFLRPPIIVTL